MYKGNIKGVIMNDNEDELTKLLEESECNSIDVHLLTDNVLPDSDYHGIHHGNDFKPRVPKDEYQP